MARGKRREREKKKKQHKQRVEERNIAKSSPSAGELAARQPTYGDEPIRASGVMISYDDAHEPGIARQAELDQLSPEDRKAYDQASETIGKVFLGGDDEPKLEELIESDVMDEPESERGGAIVNPELVARLRECGVTLERLWMKYPSVAAIHGELQLVNLMLADRERNLSLAAEALHRYPHDVLVHTAAMRMLLEEGRLDQVLEALRGRMSLAEMLPERSLFHVDEAISFIWLLGDIFLESNKLEKALVCLDELDMLDPEGFEVQALRDAIYGEEEDGEEWDGESDEADGQVSDH